MYDAIVVGARCAGAPLAMLLARQGRRVLLVDRSLFPSNKMSTHLMKRAGLARLKAWGLLDRVLAAGAPHLEQWDYNSRAPAFWVTSSPSMGSTSNWLRADWNSTAF